MLASVLLFVQERHSVLVFCATIPGTVSTAVHLASLLTIPEQEQEPGCPPALTRQQLYEQISALAEGGDQGDDLQKLARVASKGVAFFNAKLPLAAKELVSKGLRQGRLRAPQQSSRAEACITAAVGSRHVACKLCPGWGGET